MNNSTTPTGHQEQCNVDSFKGKGKLCSVFSEPNDNSIICNLCHCDDTVLWNKCHYAKGYKEHNDIPPKEWVNIIFDNMETKEVKIEIPEGYEIDKENSTFECIKFKPIIKRWRYDKSANIEGYYIDTDSDIRYYNCGKNIDTNRTLFATKKQAESALAMAQISQIMANDKRFGGVVTDEEWKGREVKWCLQRAQNLIEKDQWARNYHFLAFHTQEQRELFLKENEDLVKDYLMID